MAAVAEMMLRAPGPSPAPFSGHIVAAVFDEFVTPRWHALVADAAGYPAVTGCVNCGSERVEWTSEEGGYWCPDCRTVEEETYERNDLAEALKIASSHPVYGDAPERERRHLLALVSHCLWLKEKGGRA
jgi:hypothetical protein